MKNEKKEKRNDEQVLLTFLRRTKQGKYATIDESSLAFARIKELREEIEPLTENFYYSIS